MAMPERELDQAKRHPDVVKNIIKKDGRKDAIPYTPSNPPPYPVTSVNGQTGDVTIPPTSGGRIWYATCSTASGTGAKTATSSTGDFVLQTGAMVRLKCTTANTASNPTISIDGSSAKTIQPKSGTSGMAYRWRAQEVIDLVYDGSNFIMSLGPEADTSFYGITKLSSATNSTAEDVAATPKAVKDAYDLAASKASVPVSIANGGTGATTAADARTNLGAVYKAGDTMTGNLIVSHGSSPKVIVKNTDMDTTADSLTAAEEAYFAIHDKNNKYAAYMAASESTAGLVYASFVARRVVSGSNVNNSLALRVAKDGTKSVVVSDAAAWRTALGAAPAPTIVDKSTTSSSTSAITVEYTVSGAGTVIVYAGIYSDTTSDYGTWQAEIYYDGTLIMGEGTRFTTANTQRYGASTSVPVAVTNGKKIKITLLCTKGGTKSIFRRFLCFGCTVS